MVGSILQMARDDNNYILGYGGFQTTVTLKSKINDLEVDIDCFVVLHNTLVDKNTGLLIDGKNCSIAINVKDLKDLSYPLYREYDTEINLVDDSVIFLDSNDVTQKFFVESTRPDMTINHIVLRLVTQDNKATNSSFSLKRL